MNRFFKTIAHVTADLAIDVQTSQYLFLESLGFYQAYVTALGQINKKARLFPEECLKPLRPSRMDFFTQQENFRQFIHAYINKDEEAMETHINAAIKNAFSPFNEKDIEDAVMPTAH